MSDKKAANSTDQLDASEMGFLAHLIELRDRLLRMVLAIGVVFVILFPFAQDLYQWLAAPVIAQGKGMIATGPIAPVFIPYKVALLAAFLIALPYIFYQLWAFVAPGLYKHEKRLIVPLLTSSIALFYMGIAFAYYLLLPMVFKVVQAMTPAGVMAVPDISSYLDFVMMIFIAFGFGFEMPIATILLITTGITTAEKLGQKRPYVIVAAFIIGMLLTPPDVVSQIMLAIPMWFLFEIGLFASRFFKQRISEASAARETMDAQEENTANNTSTATATATGAAAAHTPMWEDDEYTYEEVNTTSADASDEHEDHSTSDDDDYVPLTDEEMEAELDRIEAEEAREREQEKADEDARKE